jgi:hypothetical protein
VIAKLSVVLESDSVNISPQSGSLTQNYDMSRNNVPVLEFCVVSCGASNGKLVSRALMVGVVRRVVQLDGVPPVLGRLLIFVAKIVFVATGA